MSRIFKIDDPELVVAGKVAERAGMCTCDRKNGKVCDPCSHIANGIRDGMDAGFSRGKLKGRILQMQEVLRVFKKGKNANAKVKMFLPSAERMKLDLEERYAREGS